MKIPGVISAMIIADLKCVSASLDICMPPDTLKDCVDAIMLAS